MPKPEMMVRNLEVGQIRCRRGCLDFEYQQAHVILLSSNKTKNLPMAILILGISFITIEFPMTISHAWQ